MQKKTKKKTGINEHLYSKPLWPFLKGTETKYEMKTRRVLINKERKHKEEEDLETSWFWQKFPSS